LASADGLPPDLVFDWSTVPSALKIRVVREVRAAREAFAAAHR
jgi:hypothetical protein